MEWLPNLLRHISKQNCFSYFIQYQFLELIKTYGKLECLRDEAYLPVGAHTEDRNEIPHQMDMCGHSVDTEMAFSHRQGLLQSLRRMKVDYMQRSKMEGHPPSQQNLTQVDHQKD